MISQPCAVGRVLALTEPMEPPCPLDGESLLRWEKGCGHTMYLLCEPHYSQAVMMLSERPAPGDAR